MSIEQIKTTSQYEFRHRITIHTGKEKELEVDVVINIKFQNGELEGAEMSLWPNNVYSRPEILEILKKLEEIIPRVLPNAQLRQSEPLVFNLINTEFVYPIETGHPSHPDSEITTFHGNPTPILEKIEAEMQKEFSVIKQPK